MWNAHKHIEFRFVNSHDKTAAVRDSSLRETLRRRLVERLNLSKRILLIITEDTKKDTDWVPFEIEYAIDICKLPIFAAYPEYNAITAPGELSHLWPNVLKNRIENDTARVIHMPFRKDAVFDAISQFDVFNTTNLVGGYNYYTKKAQVVWGYF